MPRMLAPLRVGLLLLALASPAAAQDPDVSQQRFAFLANRLTVRVLVETPGTLRIMRGEPGLLEVSGKAPGGWPGFGLAGPQGDELHLTAGAAGRVDYLVIVPEGIRVRVQLPDRPASEVVASTRDLATFAWHRSPPR